MLPGYGRHGWVVPRGRSRGAYRMFGCDWRLHASLSEEVQAHAARSSPSLRSSPIAPICDANRERNTDVGALDEAHNSHKPLAAPISAGYDSAPAAASAWGVHCWGTVRIEWRFAAMTFTSALLIVYGRPSQVWERRRSVWRVIPLNAAVLSVAIIGPLAIFTSGCSPIPSPSGCVINAQDPHLSSHVAGTINAVGTINCNGPVQQLDIKVQLFEGELMNLIYTPVGTTGTATNTGQSSIQANSWIACAQNGSFESVATGDSHENGLVYSESAQSNYAQLSCVA